MKEMDGKNGGIKSVVVKTGATREKPTQAPFRPPRNPHTVTETYTRDPSYERRANYGMPTEPLIGVSASWDVDVQKFFPSKVPIPLVIIIKLTIFYYVIFI